MSTQLNFKERISSRLRSIVIVLLIIFTTTLVFFKIKATPLQLAADIKTQTYEGHLEVTYLDNFKTGNSEIYYYLQPKDGQRYKLDIGSHRLTNLVNKLIKVKGTLHEDTIKVEINTKGEPQIFENNTSTSVFSPDFSFALSNLLS